MPRSAAHRTMSPEASRLLGASIGRRIREARQERGLSLAQLGGADLSRGFISAVELGRSRISLESLAIIARRLELPIGYFLDEDTASAEDLAELALDRAEAAIRTRHPAETLRLLGDLAEDAGRGSRALLLHGWALADLGRPREAIPLLQQALPQAEQSDDPHHLMQVEYALAMAFFAAANYDDAHAYFRRVHEYAHQASDDALLGRITVCIGHILFAQGNFDGALAQYARARQLFDAVDDLDNLASVYARLSRVQQHRGDLKAALRYSRLSLGIHEARHNEREVAHELSNMAARLEDLGELTQALETAQTAVDRARTSRARDIEALARSTLAAVYLRLDDLTRAAEEAQAAQVLAPAQTDLGHIDALIVLAKIAARGDDPAVTDGLFRQALEALEAAGFSARYADIALAYSHSLQERGDTHGALEYARRAALALSGRRS